MTHPHDQSQYQVRFDWARAGAETVGADVDVIVVVDVLSPAVPHVDGLRPAVVAGDLRNRTAVAEWVLARQAEKGDRFAVAVIAAGEAREDGSIRFAVEDLLGAGAIIDALAAVGIDYCSPEAAAACAAFTGLRGAVGHLLSASASGKELIEGGYTADIQLAAEVDSSTVVPVLREYRFSS
ncbi:MAG TPA: 2-phosphosulfolactate phosphatase [Terrimesophilobacter sp.]|nr:2-phosphosulfolactate phosphatase [Terrimesophilobacter sp.]